MATCKFKLQVVIALSVFVALSLGKPAPSNVLIVYASNYNGDLDGDGTQDSQQIADSYAIKRGIPSSNKLGVTVEDFATGYSSYSTFYTNLAQPLNAKLNTLGRNSIEVIFLVYPMPTNTGGRSLDNMLMVPGIFSSATEPLFFTIGNVTNPYLELAPLVGSDFGTFDSSKDVVIDGTTYDIYCVTRLDGPGRVWGLLNKVDSAIYANKYVYYGNSYQNGVLYVDNSGDNQCSTTTSSSTLLSQTAVQQGLYTTFANVDLNIAMSAFYAENGYPIKVKQEACSSALIGQNGATWYDTQTPATTAPNAIGYAGWPAYYNYLPDAWDWNPGSVACDVDSGSFGYNNYGRIRTETYNIAWGWGALKDGVTAVAGMIDAGSLSLSVDYHPRGNVMMFYLVRGYTFAEMALYSNPKLSMYSLYIGDPLLAPFSRTKTPTVDTAAPVFVSGFPKATFATNTGWVVEVKVDQTTNPEVVRVVVNWGTTIAMGTTTSSTNWGSWHRVQLPNLPQSSVVYYQVTVTDPAGLSTQSSQKSFVTGSSSPFGGTAWPVPGQIAFKDFDNGGEGIAYHDLDFETASYQNARLDTGVDLAYYGSIPLMNSFPGEWLTWTINVASAGNYILNVYKEDQVGSGTAQWQLDGSNITPVVYYPVAGNVTTQVTLPAGVHTLKWTGVASDDSMAGLGGFAIINLYPAPSPSPGSVSPSSSLVPPSPSSSFIPSPSPSSSFIPSPSPSQSLAPSSGLSISPSPPVLSSPPSVASRSPSPTTNSSSAKKSSFPIIPIAVGAAGGALLCLILVIAAVLLWRKKKRDDDLKEEDEAVILNDIKPARMTVFSSMSAPVATIALESPPVSPRTSWIIPFDDIKILSKIGPGTFGQVFMGLYRQKNVAVKQLYQPEQPNVDIKDFFVDSLLMQNLRPHLNVVSLTGVCTVPMCVVSDFAPNGSLEQYLASGESLTPEQKVEIMHGVAAGMLHLHKQGVIHRNLAARNIMLDENFNPRVSDYGMQRVALKSTQASVVPLKWMVYLDDRLCINFEKAPESLMKRTYTIKSDAWSFGVVLYEILMEEQPYPNIPATDIAVLVLDARISLVNDILEKIHTFPPVLVSLMKQCLENDPETRPDFSQILAAFE